MVESGARPGPHRAAGLPRALALAVIVASMAGLACGASPPETQPAAAGAPAARIDVPFKFGPDGSALADRSQLPIAPGAVTATWYTFRGWKVAVLEGLDLKASPPLCVGTSILNSDTNQVEQITNSPATAGACEGGGTGEMPLAPAGAGLRACGGTVSFVTTIPAEAEGVLFVTILALGDDGGGVGVSGRVHSRSGALVEIDGSRLDCRALPMARAIQPRLPTPTPAAVPTPAPGSTGSLAAARREPPPPLSRPPRCAPVEATALQDVTETAAAPYFVHHPATDNPDAPTVVFLPGGSGRRGSAERVWENFFGEGANSGAFRVVLPYSLDSDFIDGADRTFAIVNEVLWCFGGDPAKVHLAGTSNGGLAAFALMMKHPQYFASLLGAPGAFPVQDPKTVDPVVWQRALAGRAVFNGVGAFDSDWKAEVISTHNALAAAGIESVFVEFAGQPHVLSPAFDESVFLQFWLGH